MNHSDMHEGNEAERKKPKSSAKKKTLLGCGGCLGILIIFSIISGILAALGVIEEPEPEIVTVPDVVALPGDEAREQIADAGLNPSNESEDGAVFNPANWEVESTSPEAGEEVEEDTEVELHMVRPDEEEEVRDTVTVPDVVALPGDEAREQIADAGLNPSNESEDGAVFNPANWEVESTSPEAGEEVEEDTEVELHMVRPDDEEDEPEPEEEIENEDEDVDAGSGEEESAAEDDDFTVTHDDYDLNGMLPGGTTTVEFEIADNFSQGLIASGAQRETFAAVEAALEAHPGTSRVLVEGSFPTVDEYGNESDSVIMRPFYERETIDNINFDNQHLIDIWDLRDGGMIHPDLWENR